MRVVRIAGIVLCGWGLAVAIAGAADQNVGFTAKVGTLGYGGDLSLGLTDHVGLRAGYTVGEISHSVSLSEADVEGAIKCNAIPLMIDFFPAGGSFRITFGAVANNNKITLSADPKESLKLNGVPYFVDSLDGTVKFDKWSPYVGIGCGNAVSKDGNWYFSCDIGIMYHGQPNASATAEPAPGEDGDILNAALDWEIEKFNDDVKGFVVWPVISVGVSVRF